MKSVTILFISLGVVLCPPLLHAEIHNSAITRALNSLVHAKERVQIQALRAFKLDDQTVTAVLWTLLGPTYWRTHLSIVNETSDPPKVIATIPVQGLAKTIDGIDLEGNMLIQTLMPGPNDPICCPSQLKTLKFRFQNGELIELKEALNPESWR